MRLILLVTSTILVGLGVATMIDRLPLSSDYEIGAASSAHTSPERPQSIHGPRVSPSGRTLAFYSNFGKQRGRIQLERTSTREPSACLSYNSRFVVCFEFLATDESLMACYHDGSIVRWRYADDEWRSQLVDNIAEEIRCCASSVDGRHLAIGCDSGLVMLYETGNSARLVLTLKGVGSVACVRFSPSGKELLSGHANQTLQVWNIDNGRLTATLNGHSGAVRVMTSSSDGRVLVSGDDDGTLVGWDPITKKRMWSVRNSEGGIQSLAVSPNGETLAVGTMLFGRVQLRDPSTGRLTAAIAVHQSTVSGTAFLADGTLVTCGHDGEIQHLTPKTVKRYTSRVSP